MAPWMSSVASSSIHRWTSWPLDMAVGTVLARMLITLSLLNSLDSRCEGLAVKCRPAPTLSSVHPGNLALGGCSRFPEVAQLRFAGSHGELGSTTEKFESLHGSMLLAAKEAPRWAPQGQPPTTLEAERGGSASKLAAYALWPRKHCGAPARPWPERKLPDQINGFGAPPPANLDGKHNYAASENVLHQLRIRALLGPPGEAQHGPRRPALVASGGPCGRQSRHKGSVDGKLGAAPQGQTVSNDFNAAAITGNTRDVQVLDQRAHGGASLPTHSGGWV